MGKRSEVEPRAERNSFHAHVYFPDYMGAKVTKLMRDRKMGPSEFFRSLYDQAVAAKLPIVDETKQGERNADHASRK